MLPDFFATDQLHSPPRSAEIQPMSQQDASATRPYCGLVLDTRAVAACPRRSNLPGSGQDCWLATCQDWWTGVSRGTEARFCREHDVLARCLAERQTCLQQRCGSLVAASASATRLMQSVILRVDFCSMLNEHELGTAEFVYCKTHKSACIEHQSAIRMSFGSVLLRHGLNFVERGGTQHYLLSDEKVSHFTRWRGDIFQVWSVRSNSLFSSETT